MVFISYSSKNNHHRQLVEEFLSNKGVPSLWIDKDHITVGQNISDGIKDGVQKSACCVFLLNRHSLTSKWCIAEVGAFWGAGKPVIVYPIEPRCKMPEFLAGIKIAESPDEVVAICRKIEESKKIDDDLLTLPPPYLEAFLRCGLAQAFRIPVADHDREDRVDHLVTEEFQRSDRKRFRLLASSGLSYLRSTGRVWKGGGVGKGGLGAAIVEGGAELSAVLESPFSPFALARALANNVPYDHWKDKGVDVEELAGLVNKYAVTVRITEHPVNCSLFLTSQAVFYDPYLWGRPSTHRRTENNFWVLEFRKAMDQNYDCYGLLEKHYDFLWNNSETLVS